MSVYDTLKRRLMNQHRKTGDPLLLEAAERLGKLEERDGEPLEIEETTLNQTCMACPSQWSAWTSEGLYVYIRYRSAHLSVEIIDTGLPKGTEPPLLDYDDKAITWFDAVLPCRDPLDGWIDISEVCEIANVRVV